MEQLLLLITEVVGRDMEQEVEAPVQVLHYNNVVTSIIVYIVANDRPKSAGMGLLSSGAMPAGKY